MKLILVPTPIGNLEDITIRALEVLKTADIIAAEDTRHSIKLLNHYQISKPLTSLHQHNEHHKLPSLLDKVMREGLTLALITDAGTPGISDPGFLAVREALVRNIHVETLPGPTAFVPALVNSGLPCDRFVFEGFLPTKKGRQTRLTSLKDEKRTMIFYESPMRITKTLANFVECLGAERPCAVSRELTKQFEQTIRGTLTEVKEHFEKHACKGECVVVVAGCE